MRDRHRVHRRRLYPRGRGFWAADRYRGAAYYRRRDSQSKVSEVYDDQPVVSFGSAYIQLYRLRLPTDRKPPQRCCSRKSWSHLCCKQSEFWHCQAVWLPVVLPGSTCVDCLQGTYYGLPCRFFEGHVGAFKAWFRYSLTTVFRQSHRLISTSPITP